jgi:hypothetical protein
MLYKLYVKTHNKTGKKYLGQTKKEDAHSYPGSGIYWTRHLQQHGNDWSTEIIKECKSMDELRQWGLYYSELWDVVNNEEWANLKPESGDGSSGMKHTDETKKRMSLSRNGHSTTEETKKKIGLANSKKTRSDETKKKISESLTGRKNSPLSEETKKKISESQIGKVISEETRFKLREARKNQKPITDAGRKKISETHKGKIVSNETKKKLSSSLVGKKNKLGKKDTNETKKKKSEAQLGKKKNNGPAVSAAKKGKPWTKARRTAQQNRKKNNA